MMDMKSRNQYLKELRGEYLKTKLRKEKSKLLDEAEKRTNLDRKYLVKKLKSKSNLDKLVTERKKRTHYYDGQVRVALATCWRIFDHPCGQRLKTLLINETQRLRNQGELICSDEVTEKLEKISFRTIDEKLKHAKEVERQKKKYHYKIHPLLYQKIPIKVFSEQDRESLGNIQIDLIEHCGTSATGEFICTLSTTDIMSGWWEGGAVMGKSQHAVFEALTHTRNRFPFPFIEIHSDNGTEFINNHLYRYCDKQGLRFSRSRPYKKNDNCLVEQKNWTHVKKFVGYLRYDTQEEMKILNDLYNNEMRLHKNFFQPVMKLESKIRERGKIKRKYDDPKTPYHRVIEMKDIPEKTKKELTKTYESLNPAELKRTIDQRLKTLYGTYGIKNKSLKVEPTKKLIPASVSSFIAQSDPISVS